MVLPVIVARKIAVDFHGYEFNRKDTEAQPQPKRMEDGKFEGEDEDEKVCAGEQHSAG